MWVKIKNQSIVTYIFLKHEKKIIVNGIKTLQLMKNPCEKSKEEVKFDAKFPFNNN